MYFSHYWHRCIWCMLEDNLLITFVCILMSQSTKTNLVLGDISVLMCLHYLSVMASWIKLFWIVLDIIYICSFVICCLHCQQLEAGLSSISFVCIARIKAKLLGDFGKSLMLITSTKNLQVGLNCKMVIRFVREQLAILGTERKYFQWVSVF